MNEDHKVGYILNRIRVQGNPPPKHYTILIDGKERYALREEFEVL